MLVRVDFQQADQTAIVEVTVGDLAAAIMHPAPGMVYDPEAATKTMAVQLAAHHGIHPGPMSYTGKVATTIVRGEHEHHYRPMLHQLLPAHQVRAMERRHNLPQ